MKEQILKELKEIEEENKVKIIYAIEAGSRVWGMASKDSDYDVRFVFVRKKDEYLGLDKKPDVIDVDRHLPDRDYVGFDIHKFLNMLRCSNPATIEWLTSDIKYLNEIILDRKLIQEARDNFNPLALFHHYKSMCKQNYLKYLKSGSKVTYKKYLYAMRGLLNATWVFNHNSVPPINFGETINKINPITNPAKFPKVAETREIVPNWILKKLSDIIYLKSQGKEKDIIENIVKMDNYIEAFLKSTDAPASKKKFDIRIFNEVLFKELELA